MAQGNFDAQNTHTHTYIYIYIYIYICNIIKIIKIQLSISKKKKKKREIERKKKISMNGALAVKRINVCYMEKVHMRTHYPIFFSSFYHKIQTTNSMADDRLKVKKKIQNSKFKFKIKILQYYVFIQEYSHIFSVITTNWKPQRKKPYRVAFSLYKHQESFICPLLRSWKR